MQAARASRRVAILADRLRGVRAPWRSRVSRSCRCRRPIRCAGGWALDGCRGLARDGERGARASLPAQRRSLRIGGRRSPCRRRPSLRRGAPAGGCEARPRARDGRRRQAPPRAASRRGRRPGAGASPRSSGSGCASSRSRRSRRAQSGGLSQRTAALDRCRIEQDEIVSGAGRALSEPRPPATRASRSDASDACAAHPGVAEGTGARAGASLLAGSADPTGSPSAPARRRGSRSRRRSACAEHWQVARARARRPCSRH